MTFRLQRSLDQEGCLGSSVPLMHLPGSGGSAVQRLEDGMRWDLGSGPRLVMRCDSSHTPPLPSCRLHFGRTTPSASGPIGSFSVFPYMYNDRIVYVHVIFT